MKKFKLNYFFGLNKINFFLLLILVILFVFLIFEMLIIQEVFVLNYSAKADNTLGFNVNNSELNFGRVYPGGNVIKTVSLESKEKMYTLIVARGSGNKNLVYSDNNFMLQGKKEVNITFLMPLNAEIGSIYNGNIKFIFFKSLF